MGGAKGGRLKAGAAGPQGRSVRGGAASAGIPFFEFGDFGFGYDDAFGRGDAELQLEFAQKPEGDVGDGFVGHQYLTVGSVEVARVELVRQGVERFRDGMGTATAGDVVASCCRVGCRLCR